MAGKNIVELDEERKAAMVSNLIGRTLRRTCGIAGDKYRYFISLK